MILTLDIGNTNIKTALFDGKEMRYYWRMSTNIQKSSDEYGIVLVNLFQHVGVRPEEVEGIMISSVVPTINFTIEHMCQNYFGKTPLFVPEEDGAYFHFDVPVCVSPQFYGWVCGFGGKVEVTAPAEVRKGIHDMVQALAKQHD